MAYLRVSGSQRIRQAENVRTKPLLVSGIPLCHIMRTLGTRMMVAEVNYPLMDALSNNVVPTMRSKSTSAAELAQAHDCDKDIRCVMLKIDRVPTLRRA
jgi:hypothetical protein